MSIFTDAVNHNYWPGDYLLVNKFGHVKAVSGNSDFWDLGEMPPVNPNGPYVIVKLVELKTGEEASGNKYRSFFDEDGFPKDTAQLVLVWEEGQKRVCTICHERNLGSGFIYGDDLYCDEHEPEGFAKAYQDNDASYQCCWTTWPKAVMVDNVLRYYVPPANQQTPYLDERRKHGTD